MNLYSHYKLNFDIVQYHKFTLGDIDDMIPFERDLYVEMIKEKIKREQDGTSGSTW